MQRSRFAPMLVTAAFATIVLLGRGGPATAGEVAVHDYAGGNGLGLAGKLVVPTEPGTYPLAVVSHGWSSSATYFVGWGKVIASLGFVVVVPSFPNPLMPDMVEDGKIIERLVEHFRSAPADSPAFGRVDPARLALVGHSGGGNSTAMAAMTLRPNATVLLDPVDTSGLTKGRLDELCGPVLTMFAAPSSCNQDNGWEPRVGETSGPRYAFHVVGSTHCDGEKPARAACGPFCGGAATPKSQAEMQRYIEAMLAAYVLGDAEALALLDEAALAANPALDALACDPGQDSCVPLPWDEDTDSETAEEPDTDTVEVDTQETDAPTSGDTEEPVDTGATDTGEEEETDEEPMPAPVHEAYHSAESSCFVASVGRGGLLSLLALLLAF